MCAAFCIKSPPGTLFAASDSYVQCEELEEGGVNTTVMGLVIVLKVVAELIMAVLWRVK